MRCARPWVLVRPLRLMRTRSARRLIVQVSRTLPALRRSENGGDRRALRRSRDSRRSRSSVGPHTSLSAPVSLCLGYKAHDGGSSRLPACAVCRPATTGTSTPRGSRWTEWVGHFHPALRVGAQPNAALSRTRARLGLSRTLARSGIVCSASASASASVSEDRRPKTWPVFWPAQHVGFFGSSSAGVSIRMRIRWRRTTRCLRCARPRPFARESRQAPRRARTGGVWPTGGLPIGSRPAGVTERPMS